MIEDVREPRFDYIMYKIVHRSSKTEKKIKQFFINLFLYYYTTEKVGSNFYPSVVSVCVELRSRLQH